jgi:hypothetical protein
MVEGSCGKRTNCGKTSMYLALVEEEGEKSLQRNFDPVTKRTRK